MHSGRALNFDSVMLIDTNAAIAKMQYTFILVEPAVAENVGSSARALKTMGFDRLVVVNSQVHQQPAAIWLAHGSSDILDNIKVFDTLGEAVQGMDLVIGTTAKKRRIHADHYFCSEIPRLINRKSGSVDTVALVFGREESGLTNEELKLCHLFTGIPMKKSYPSLNLAQSVMIYAWELSKFNTVPTEAKTVRNDNATGSINRIAKRPSGEKLRHLRKSVETLLQTMDYDCHSSVYRRIMERFEVVGDKDAGLILSVCSKLEKILADRNQGRR
jgi:tRNA/rRNA methyltransferase